MTEIKFVYQEDVSRRVDCVSYEVARGTADSMALAHEKDDADVRLRVRLRKTDGGYHVAVKVRREVKS